MPQLELSTFYITSSLLFIAFWAYFAILYIAVSYAMQKNSASIYFKFYIVFISTLSVWSLIAINQNNKKNYIIGVKSIDVSNSDKINK